MKRKCAFLTVFFIILMTSLFSALEVQRVEASGTIYVRADGSVDPQTAPISTVDNVTYVLTGNITSDADGIVVERNNTVIDGAGYTVQGAGSGNGIEIASSNVTVKNLNIEEYVAGIYLLYGSNNRFSGNRITNNGQGIDLSYSSNNTVSGNNITNNGCGVYLDVSSSHNIISENVFVNDGLLVYNDCYGNVVVDNSVNGKPLVYLEGISHQSVDEAGQVILVDCGYIKVENLDLSNTTVGLQLVRTENTTVAGNNVTANDGSGISLASSSHNNISSNIIANNGEDGIEHSDSFNNSITGNNITANGDQGIYLVQSFNNSISRNNIMDNDEGIHLESYGLEDTCVNNSISGNNIANNGLGILCHGSNNSICGNNIRNKTNFGNGIYLVKSSNFNSIIQNNITDWFVSVALQSSCNNSIIGNNIANSYDGFRFSLGSSNNSIYHNNLVNNTEQVYSSQSGYANLWDDGYSSGGNYWSDYNGADANHDGIGDTPYIIDANNTDRYPLMTPYIIPEFPVFLILPLFFIATLLAVAICKRKRNQEIDKPRMILP